MSDPLSGAVGGAIGWSVGQRFNRRRAGRLASSARVECALRRTAETAGGSTRGWTHGIAALSPGRLQFSAYLPPGIRIRNPFRPRLIIEVTSVSSVGRRLEPSMWGVGDGTVGVTLVGTSGTFEFGLQPSSVAGFVAAVEPGPSPQT